MATVKKWVDGAITFVEEPDTDNVVYGSEVAPCDRPHYGPTMSDLWDTITRIERKVDMLGRRAGAFTTLEGVTSEEKDSLRGDK